MRVFVGKKGNAWPKFDLNGVCGQRWAGVVLTRCTGTGDTESSEIYRPCAPCRTGASCTCRTLSEQPHYAQQCARWVQVATPDFKATIEHQISRNTACVHPEMRPIVWGSTNSGHCVQWHHGVLKPTKPQLRSYWMVREWTFQKPWRRFVCPALVIHHCREEELPYGNLEEGNSRSWGPTTEEIRLTP